MKHLKPENKFACALCDWREEGKELFSRVDLAFEGFKNEHHIPYLMKHCAPVVVGKFGTRHKVLFMVPFMAHGMFHKLDDFLSSVLFLADMILCELNTDIFRMNIHLRHFEKCCNIIWTSYDLSNLWWFLKNELFLGILHFCCTTKHHRKLFIIIATSRPGRTTCCSIRFGSPQLPDRAISMHE